jgi:ABC-type bacteriocin/lantibiotic exporter with double-glycine peptidase domain
MSGALEVNHATFRYGDYGRTILNDVSFRVEEGESIGIVGLSGGGKSTLLKLLMGFYDLTSGKIYYGGYNLETIDLRYLRKQMGVVLQDGKLSVGDIYGNVADNDPRVGLAVVMDAIRKAGLEEMVKALPGGLHTRIENCPLSDGERQKLLIARAIVKKNKFIFLDEATSSLDNISQGMVLKNLESVPSTKIIIAQRLATVQYCNKIIVLEHGKITMQGTYDKVAENHVLFRQTVS